MKKCLKIPKEVSRSRKSKDRQYNGKRKRINKDLHNITQKRKDRARRTLLKSRMNSDGPEGKFLFCMWHPSCYFCNKSGDKSCMRKEM
jgi:hypothetical protein